MGTIRIDAADKYFSKAVRLRDKNTCRHCGKEGRQECCHIIGRANRRVRWSAHNAIAMCHYCHRYMTANPLDFYAFLEGELGAPHLENLRLVSNEIYKTNQSLRNEIAAHYREQVRQLEQDENHELLSWN